MSTVTEIKGSRRYVVALAFALPLLSLADREGLGAFVHIPGPQGRALAGEPAVAPPDAEKAGEKSDFGVEIIDAHPDAASPNQSTPESGQPTNRTDAEIDKKSEQPDAEWYATITLPSAPAPGTPKSDPPSNGNPSLELRATWEIPASGDNPGMTRIVEDATSKMKLREFTIQGGKAEKGVFRLPSGSTGGVDLRAVREIVVHRIFLPEEVKDGLSLSVAIVTGPQWVWFEAQPQTLTPGWNAQPLRFDLRAKNWKSAASAWKHEVPPQNLEQTWNLGLLFLNGERTVHCHVGGIELVGAEGVLSSASFAPPLPNATTLGDAGRVVITDPLFDDAALIKLAAEQPGILSLTILPRPPGRVTGSAGPARGGADTLMRPTGPRVPGITDEGVKALENLTALRSLTITTCLGVTDEGLKSIALLSKLENLRLGGPVFDHVTDKGIKALSTLPQLQSLYIDQGIDATDEGLEALSKASSLHSIYLFSRHFTDEGVKALADLKRLRSISLLVTPHITDEGLKALAGLEELHTISFISAQGVSDEGLMALSAMPRLRRINIRAATRVTENGVSEFNKRLPGCQVIWKRNVLPRRGAIPATPAGGGRGRTGRGATRATPDNSTPSPGNTPAAEVEPVR